MMDKVNYHRIKAVLAEKRYHLKSYPSILIEQNLLFQDGVLNDVQPSVEVFYQIAKLLDINIRELFVATK